MTGNIAKTPTPEEKSPVKVRRKELKMFDIQRISVFRGPSGRSTGTFGNQWP